MTHVDFAWDSSLALDVNFGYVEATASAPRRFNPRVVLNTDDTSVLRALREELRNCETFTFSVAFVSARALALLKQELVELRDSGRTGTIITSDYLTFNAPRAFDELLHLKEQFGIDVRIHRAAAFHPKGYVFESAHTVTVLMGSSNLTEAAISSNHEWNLQVSAAHGSDLADQLSSLVARQADESAPLTQEWLDDYRARYVPPLPRPRRQDAGNTPVSADESTIVPNRMQQEAMEAIARVREQGGRRALVVSATGTGKTILSALDARSCAPRRLLFVVHREQILDRSIEEYHRVLGGPLSDYGKLTGGIKQHDRRYVFSTVQTLSRHLDTFAPDAFDYVVIDEAHRAGAEGHRRVLTYFEPTFLLGMTATPERTDEFNVFELFDYNVPYEIRLQHALEEDMLTPFHYYGITDVSYANGTSPETDPSLLITPERVDHLVTALDLYGQAGVAPRGLIFCSRKDEARRLSEALNARTLRGVPLRTLALAGDDSLPNREAAVERLESGDLHYLLTVDIFNEGVDIPSVNQVIMLRETQSSIVFVQQLGRGLRKARDKEYLVVIDVIGNYTNNYMIPIALFGNESLNKESLRKSLITAEERGVLPGLSSVRFDRIAQERVLSAISNAKLDSARNLRRAVLSMEKRLGRPPTPHGLLGVRIHGSCGTRHPPRSLPCARRVCSARARIPLAA
ncbi:DEAD/DEAH box helicase family protein [Microbacterium sp. gxy059]|uniref:DEAD/DEAH box helicase family protein n=1 Tax=Microbacterium sp. gxy059 TaxID=2957199 RepID=UPI003D951B72